MNNAGRIGFLIKGNYDNTATYDFLDVVYFGNSSYVAKKLTTSNTPENNSEYWQILASTPDSNEWQWKSNSGQPSWVWGGNEAHNYSVWNPANFNVSHALTSSMPAGFGNRMETASWGNQTGSCITCWNDDATGSLQFRKNNPENGQLSVLADGYFYQREGMKRCLDESDKLPENMGNNGTGGISAGKGLQLETYVEIESEFTFDVTVDDSTIVEFDYDNGFGPAFQTYGFRMSVSCQEDPNDYFSRYEGCFLGEDKDISYSNSDYNTSLSFFDGMFVQDGELYFCYSDVMYAENTLASIGYSSCTIKIGKNYTCTYDNQFIFGTYNAARYNSAFVVGNGTASSRSNAMRLNSRNQMYLGSGGAYNSSGADHAEFIKPWADKNPAGEDRVGYLVTIKDGLLYKAEAGDFILGITSGNPCVVGNADEDYYWKYERDEFNRIIMEYVPEEIQKTDEEGNPVFDEETGEPVVIKTGNMVKQPKIAENYNPAMQESYVERKDRSEWDYVGMLGVLPVRDDGTCLPGQFCRCGQGGIATQTAEKDFNSYFVIERISENVISVLFN